MRIFQKDLKSVVELNAGYLNLLVLCTSFSTFHKKYTDKKTQSIKNLDDFYKYRVFFQNNQIKENPSAKRYLNTKTQVEKYFIFFKIKCFPLPHRQF